MTEMKLYKKKVAYKDKNTGEEKTAVNFSLKLGDALIPIEVKFFPDKETKKDLQYASRRAVVLAFAEELPDKE